jgi:hypothetical protein
MASWTRNAITIIMTASVLQVTPALGDVKVERADYHGWKDCWRLSNGTVDLVYVPAIGRIMRYGFVGKANVLWENPKMLGLRPMEAKDWQNFGGDKLWPGPQTVWGWSPDPELDPGVHEVSGIRDGLLVKGKPSGKSGIRFEREITLAQRGTEVRIVNRMINSSAKPVKWAVWDIAQVEDPELATIPRSPAEIHPKGYYPFPDNPPLEERLTVGENEVSIRRDHAKSAKIGSYSKRSTASATKSGQRFTITVDDAAEPSERYPHGGGRQEIYTNPDPDSYVELELLGPVRELKTGEKAELKLRWRLHEVR